MSSWEMQVVSAIVRAGEEAPKRFEEALKQRIRLEYFESIEAKPIWARLEAYYRRSHNFGHMPSEETFREWFPKTPLIAQTENFADLCEHLKTSYVRRKVDHFVEEYTDHAKQEPVVALQNLMAGLATLQEDARMNTDINFRETIVRDTTEDLENVGNDGLTGMPWPWLKLNEDTQGIQAGDYILVWALPKSMKTFFGLVVAAHLYMAGHRVLIYSKEMTWKILRKRLACIICKVNYDNMKKGRLTAAEQHRMLAMLTQLTENTGHDGQLYFTQADRMDGGPGGPAEIQRKIEMYNPAFVMLDSSYMLEMPNAGGGNALDWKNLSAVSRALKQLCKNTGVAMMAIMQENEQQAIKFKGTRGTASMSMNKGAAADCDLGLRLVMNKQRGELSIHYAVMREATANGFTINALACDNFDLADDPTHLWNVGDDAEQTQAEQKGAPELPKAAAGSAAATQETPAAVRPAPAPAGFGRGALAARAVLGLGPVAAVRPSPYTADEPDPLDQAADPEGTSPDNTEAEDPG